jgi:O-antigen ligase
MAGLLAATVWAPVPLGSNRPWAAALLAMGLWCVLSFAVLARLLAHTSLPRPAWARALPPLLALAAMATLVVGQWLGVGGRDSPWALRSQDTAQTGFYALVCLAYLAAWLLVLLCVNSQRRVAMLLGGVVAGGVVQALLAVALHAGTGGSYSFLFVEFNDNGRASGTFPNPDHLAGYMELCLSAGFGLLVAQFGSHASGRSAPGWQARWQAAAAFLLSRKMLLRLLLVVMVVALVMTHSRMGNGAFFAALLLVGCIVATVSHKLRRPALWLVASMVLIDVIIIGQWVGLDRVVDRLQGTAVSTVAQAEVAAALPELHSAKDFREESIQERMRIPLLATSLVQARPWFGHGAGTFYIALPAIKPAGFPHLWDHAHNDYVEWAVDTGLVGLGLLLSVAALTAWRALHLLRDREPRLHRGVGTAALMALACLGLHSLVDFNLQIPANGLTLVLLLALPWAVPVTWPARAARRTSARSHGAAGAQIGAAPQPPRAHGLAALAALAICGAVLWWGGPMLAADFGTQGVRQQISRCATTSATWTDADWQDAQARMAWGIRLTPENATLHDVLAQLFACHGAALWLDEPQRTLLYTQAMAEHGIALRLRPNYGPTWAGLAVARYVVNDEPDRINAAWQAALKSGPHEATVQVALFDLGLRVWDTATPVMRKWLTDQFAAADPKGRQQLTDLAERLGRAGVLLPNAQELGGTLVAR